MYVSRKGAQSCKPYFLRTPKAAPYLAGIQTGELHGRACSKMGRDSSHSPVPLFPWPEAMKSRSHWTNVSYGQRAGTIQVNS